MVVQNYLDCERCEKRLAIVLVDYKKKLITFYPTDYFDAESGTTKIQELHLTQELDTEKCQKIVIIQCPRCGNFSINNIPYDCIVDAGFIEILTSISSSGTDTVEHVKETNNIKGDDLGHN